MQRCNCIVRLAGDMQNTVFKSGVSPAEIAVLRLIHGGQDTVVDIQPIEMDKTPHRQERDRLIMIYGAGPVDHLFPGVMARLPITLKEIEGPGEDEEAEEIPSDDEDEAATGQAPLHAPPPAIDELSDDDLALIDKIKAATNKNTLVAIARENEVIPSHLPDKLEAMKKALLKELFPDLEK